MGDRPTEKPPASRAFQIAKAIFTLAGFVLIFEWNHAYAQKREPAHWAIVLLALVFVTGFLLTSRMLARDNGWDALAAKYRALRRPQGRDFGSHQITRIGGIQEGGVTRLLVAAEGLYLYPVALFRMGRPPLLIPWENIRSVRQRRDLIFRTWELDLGGITTIRIRRKAYEQLEAFVPAPGTVAPRAGEPPPPIE